MVETDRITDYQESIAMGKKSRPIVNPTDYLVRNDFLRCLDGHDYKTRNIKVRVIAKNGVVFLVEFPGGQCLTCGKYYVKESVYRQLEYKGIPLCRAITIDDNKTMLNGTYNYNTETLLHSVGYNVSDKKDYSAIQRQKLLAIVIDEDIVDKNEIISHLQYLVKRSERRANMKMACQKWNEDIFFLKNMDDY